MRGDRVWEGTAASGGRRKGRTRGEASRATIRVWNYFAILISDVGDFGLRPGQRASRPGGKLRAPPRLLTLICARAPEKPRFCARGPSHRRQNRHENRHENRFALCSSSVSGRVPPHDPSAQVEPECVNPFSLNALSVSFLCARMLLPPKISANFAANFTPLLSAD